MSYYSMSYEGVSKVDLCGLKARAFKIGIKNETVFGNTIRCCCYSVRSEERRVVKNKHANGLKHQTQPLMGATRLASGKDSAIIW